MVICVPWGDIFILGENCIEKRKREKQERKSESQPTCFIMHYVVCQSKWWNIHYPKLEGEKTESCNKIILSHIKKLMGEIDLKQEVAITLNYDVKTRTDKRTDF